MDVYVLCHGVSLCLLSANQQEVFFYTTSLQGAMFWYLKNTTQAACKESGVW